MLSLTPQGLYCAAGNFYIDPKGSVENAVVTHAHSDHARRGAKNYFTPRSGISLLRCRLGANISVKGIAYGETFQFGPVKLSFHPAGHILGSSQVRMEYGGEVWVASGDYKREPDPTAEPFEVVPCDVFVTEATFGTPAYQWEKRDLAQEILEWWTLNAAQGFHSVVFAYSLGKTQRVLGELYGLAPKPIYCAPEAERLIECYREEGVKLAPSLTLRSDSKLEGELILAPSSFRRSPLVEELSARFRTAFASGWMAKGTRGFDHGFVMSDHADWNDLVRTVKETGARRVYVQHRGSGALVRHLKGLGIKAFAEEVLAKPQLTHAAQLSLF